MYLFSRGKLNKIIPSDSKEVLREIMRFRNALEDVESHSHVTIPLVYKVVSSEIKSKYKTPLH